tara:strand:+ start:1138 stop:5292 length:4155 start_codon:yes stop_codon:yes gene_type:complete
MIKTLKKIVEDSTDLVCALDAKGKILWVNNASKEVLGLSPSKLKGKLYSELVHEKDVKKWENATSKESSDEKLSNKKIRHIHKDGHDILIECSVNWDSKEKIFYVVGKTIPERTEPKDELKDSDKMYQILFDLSPVPKYVYDLKTLQIVEVNQAAIDHYGYSKDEFLNMKIQELRIESDIPELMKAIKKYKTSEGIIRFGVYRHRKKNGSIVEMDISGQKFDFDGQTRVMIVSHDVTGQQNDLKRKKFLADIRQIFSQEKVLKRTLKDLLAYVVDTGEFHLGEIWLTSRDHRLLSLTTAYPKSDLTSVFYEKSSELKVFKKGIGLPGSVWKGKKTEIWDRIGKLKKFIRKEAAKEVGLNSAMGIPIVYNDEVLGVLLLGSRHDAQILDNFKQLYSDLEAIIGSELKRKQLEEDYNQIFKTAPDIICIIDFESSFKRINPAGCKLLGYSEDELLNMPYEELVFPDDRMKFQTQIEEYSEGDTVTDFVHRVVTRSGDIVWLDWNLSKDREEGLSYGVAKNITEQNELQKLLDSATDLAKIGGWEVDLITDTVYWSPMTKRLHEVDQDYEPDLESALNFYRDDVRENVQNFVNRAIETGESFDFELPIITAKGHERWIKSIGKVEYKNNTPGRIIGSFQDIHDRKVTELRLQNISDNIPGAIFQYILHPDGTDRIAYLSKGAELLWGHSADECMENIDVIWNQTRNGGDFEKVQNSILRSAETMEPWYCQYRSMMPDGNLIWHEGHGRPRKLADGSIIWDSLIIDITDQKEMESLLARASKMAKIGSWEMDLRQEGTDSMYWSPMTRRILEVDESYNPSLSGGFEFYSEESKKEIETAVENLINRGEKFDLELLITTRKSQEKWIRCIGEGEYANNNLVKIYGSFQDITMRKTAELAAQKALIERNTILESISDAFFAVDLEWKVTYWNREAEELLDTKSSEIVGKNLWDVFPDAVELEFYTQYHRAMDTGETVSFETYYPGTEMWFEVSAYPSDSGLSVYFKDVTQRRISNEKIRQSNERFEKVAKATNDAIYDWNIEQNELFLGEGFNTLFGHDIKNETHSVDSWTKNLHPDDKEKALDEFNSALQNRNEFNLYSEYRYLKADGTYAYVINRGNITRDESGEAQRMVGAIADITQRKNYEESLQRLNENLEQHAKELAISNRELEQFAFVTSHDLQEPLRMISSFLTQLERKYGDQLDEKANKYIYFAVDGAKRMRQIILDLLDFSTIGKSVDLKEEVDINEIVDETCLLQRKAIEETGTDIVKENLPKILAQRAVIAQIFQNLIGNAVKFIHKEGSPKIVISASESEEEWTFSVKDNGIGIEEEYFDKIFTIFQKLHQNEQYEGTGMGLAIVKKSVENLGGSIWVESTPGEGSNFIFTIKKVKT